MKIRKAIIPAAGLGTRFLPATKAMPKEMLPIVDKPTIQYIVEEAISSGIEDIIIISGRGKRAIEDHFDKSYELEDTLEKKKKYELLSEIQSIHERGNIHYIRQKEPNGLGHAVACARSFIGNEPFAVLLGDDVIEAETPCLQQLIDVYNKYECSILGVQQVDPAEVSKYGIISPKTALTSSLYDLNTVVEKPSKETAPSNHAVMGRYILTPEIFDILGDLPPGANGEIQLTDAIRALNTQQKVLAYEYEGNRFDVGDKFGFIRATIHFALQRDELKNATLNYLNEVLTQYR